MKRIMTIVALCIATCTLWGQNVVSLVVSGEGKDKEEATFKALRSAIEQAYGTFVSSNTTVLNDQLVADEIVSLSSGNIQKYEYVGENKMPNDNTFVTLSATVSIDKLVSFAESKGMEAELKGGLFAMNIKKMEFDKQAEEKAVENLCKQLETMLPTLFDYEIKLGEPKIIDQSRVNADEAFRQGLEVLSRDNQGKIGVEFSVNVLPNENLNNFIEILCKTTSHISLDDNDFQNFDNSGFTISPISFFAPIEHKLKEVFQIDEYRGSGYASRPTTGTVVLYDKTGLLMNSTDTYNCNKVCATLGLNCQLITNPLSGRSAWDADPRLANSKQVILIPTLKLRSQKSVQNLNNLYSKIVEEYYNIIISTGIREIAINWSRSNDSNIKIKSPCYKSDPRNSFWKEWPDKLRSISGTLFFTKDEISKVTSISVGKPTFVE